MMIFLIGIPVTWLAILAARMWLEIWLFEAMREPENA
jgi:hypothetical protein